MASDQEVWGSSPHGRDMAIEFRRTPEEIAEMSGHVNERFVFGSVRIGDPEYQREKQALIQRYRDMRKSVPLREALEVIKHFQPFKPDSREPADPASPVKQFPYALRKFVAEGLGMKGEKEKDVLFWTAVDSFVDKEFGADAVIEVRRIGADNLIPDTVAIDVAPEGLRRC